MATANSIITPQTPKTATCVLDTASTDIDDSPTTSVLLMTAGASGARVTSITAMPRTTVTASNLCLYVSSDGGTTKRLIDSVLMSAHTVANTTAIPTTDFGYTDDLPLILGANERLYATTAVSLAGGIVVFAQYADY